MGELQVRGEAVFKEYWRRPEETASTFTTDGWFRTGDIVEEIVAEDKRWFRILGRNSVDIIKTGGYKVSALEIEDALRAHPAIADCAVIGLPDPTWGERVAVAVILTSASEQLSLAALRAWAKTRLAPYKIPSRLISLTELPRNALGKVTKPALQTYFSGEE
jgi:malonyl-CoA/methylmalonyl-CoA synthetase